MADRPNPGGGTGSRPVTDPDDERWVQAYPQTDLPTGDQPQPYNPYRRRDDQVRLATRFGQDNDGTFIIVVQLSTPDATIRCAKFDPMARTVCQNYAYYMIEIPPSDPERKTPPRLVPSCHEHVGYLIPFALAFDTLKGPSQ